MFGAVMLLEKLRTMFRLLHPDTAGGHSELHPVIDEIVSAWPFTGAAIDLSPAGAGVTCCTGTAASFMLGSP
jgi:hypothetical protein